MCRRIECSKCGRPSYAGCGRHIEQVLGDVRPEDRCRCHEERPSDTPSPALSWLRGLFGK